MLQSEQAMALWNNLLSREEQQGFLFPYCLREPVIKEILAREERYLHRKYLQFLVRERLTRHHWLPQANDDDVDRIGWISLDWSQTDPCDRIIWLDAGTHRMIHRLFGHCRREQIHHMVDVLNTSGSGFWHSHRMLRMRQELTYKPDFPLICRQVSGPPRLSYWHDRFASVWYRLFGRLDVGGVHRMIDVFYRPPRPTDPDFWTACEVTALRKRLLREQRSRTVRVHHQLHLAA